MQAARGHAEELANRLGLAGFARIDAFMGVLDGTLFVLEINTVPGLSPNNVLFQQALLEDPPIFPGEFCRLQVRLAALPALWLACSSVRLTIMTPTGRLYRIRLRA